MVSLKCENDPKHYKLAHNGGSPIEKGAKGIFHIQKKLASYLSAAVAKRECVPSFFFSMDGVTFASFEILPSKCNLTFNKLT